MLHRSTQKVDAIGRVPLFNGLNKRELGMLAKTAEEVDVPADYTILRQGRNARELVIIVEGTARVERSGQVIAHVGAGDVVGEMGLVDGQPRSASVITETPSSLLVIESRSFWPLVEEMPALSRKLLATLSERVRSLESRYLD